MSLSTYLIPDITRPAVLDPAYRFRKLTSVPGSTTTRPNLLFNTVQMTSGTTGAVPCPDILPTSTVFITAPPNLQGAFSTTVVPGVSFTLNSTSGETIFLTYFVV
jgi:hypothetical protein